MRFLHSTPGANLCIAMALKLRGGTVSNMEFWTRPRQLELTANSED